MINGINTISIWQPYASLITLGKKKFETRGWKTLYRGKILIHASRNGQSIRNACDLLRADPSSELAILYKDVFKHIDGPRAALWALPRGCIIATAVLVNCHRTETLKVDWREKLVGDFGPDRFAWELEDVQPLPRPIPCIGQQGLFKVDLAGLA
jgi:hypothetical protein